MCFVATGEVACRLSERGCNGDMGTELERRSAFLAAVLARSSSSVCPFAGAAVAGAGFAASPRAFRVALTTWVARVAFSFVDSPLLAADAGVVGLARFDGARLTVFARDLLEFAVLVGGRLLSSVVDASSLGSSKLLRSDDMAGVHVPTDETALRTASA